MTQLVGAFESSHGDPFGGRGMLRISYSSWTVSGAIRQTSKGKSIGTQAPSQIRRVVEFLGEALEWYDFVFGEETEPETSKDPLECVYAWETVISFIPCRNYAKAAETMKEYQMLLKSIIDGEQLSTDRVDKLDRFIHLLAEHGDQRWNMARLSHRFI